MIVAALAFASVLFPSGPARMGWFLGALGLTVLGFAVQQVPISSPRQHLVDVLTLLLVIAAIGCLTYSAGGSTGLLTLLLLPLVFAALYGRPWESAVVIPAIGLTLVLVGHEDGGSPIVLARLFVVWVAALSMISLATHRLRGRLESTIRSAQEQARQSELIAEAMRALTTTINALHVVRTATRIAAELASSVKPSGGRSQYFAVVGGTFSVVADSDEAAAPAGDVALQVTEHPWLARVLEFGEPRNEITNPALHDSSPFLELHQGCLPGGAAVPVRLDGKIHGILVASGGDHAVPPSAFNRLITLGNVAELALASASARELLELQARTDPLTGLANRRELQEAFARISDRRPFAFLAIDLDDLKSTNDGWGHAAGDAAIVSVASALASVVRRGDTVARPGGDEFAILMFDASMEGAERLTRRIHIAISSVVLISGPPSLSIGCCVGAAGAAPSFVQGAADTALYEAKHRGGGCTVIRSLAVVEPAFTVEAGSHRSA